MTTRPTRHPFEPMQTNYNYRALWDANLAWGIIALSMMVLALAIWAYMASGWYQPSTDLPITTPAVEGPSPVNTMNQRVEMPPTETFSP